MLQLIEIFSPEEKEKYLQEFSVKDTTWLVSDLRTKLELQRRLFETHTVIEKEALLRASELWGHCVARLFPNLHLISRDLSQTLLTSWLREEKHIPWLQSPGSSQGLFLHMQQLLPLLIHPSARENLPEWFEDHPSANGRWREWWELGIKYLAQFIQHEVFPASWAQALLVERDLSRVWRRPLVVDLNLEMTPIEATILAELSRHQDVTILAPRPHWMSAFDSHLRGYHLLFDKAGKNASSVKQAATLLAKNDNCHLQRLSSQAAEVKNAVAQLREWLDQGLAPSDIAVVAPDMEQYWPILNLYLEEEGIACAKDEVVSLQSYLPIQRWLSRLRLALMQFERTDLESHMYGEENVRLPFEQFRVLFTHIFDPQDLSRHEQVHALYALERHHEEVVHRNSFLQWTLRYLDREMDFALIERLVAGFMGETPARLSLAMQDWISLFEDRLAKQEIAVARGRRNGVPAVNLSSLEWLSCSHVVIMGLTQDALKKADSTSLTQSDLHELLQDLGVVLNPLESSSLEFEVLWTCANSNRKNLVLSFPETDFSGAVQTPASIWLLLAMGCGRDPQKINLPGVTRWDELQMATPETRRRERDQSPELADRLQRQVLCDLGEAEEERVPVPLELRLSASSLERYAMCPYIFKAERIFRLSDHPELDMDLDHFKRGILIHHVLKSILEQKASLAWTESELRSLIDASREASGILLLDERLWSSRQKQTLQSALAFLEDEKKWREDHPIDKTVAVELDFRFSIEDGKIQAAPSAPIVIVGQIDRIDQLKDGSYLIFDYKTSLGSGYRHWKSWVKDPQEIQLALYAFVVEKGLTRLPAAPVAASLYYDLRKRLRNKGMIDAEAPLAGLRSSYNKIGAGEKEELFKKLSELLTGFSQNIKDGFLASAPVDEKICPSCSWRHQCRAPHLN